MILFLVSLLAAVPVLAQDSPVSRSFTIEEAQRVALLNSPQLLSAEQDIIIAQQRVSEATFQFLPEIGLQASASRYDARYPFALAPEYRSVLLFPSDRTGIYSGRAYLRQPVYEGGRTANLLRLAETNLKQKQTQYDAVKLDVALSAQRAFYRLLLAQEVEAAVSRRAEAAQRLLARPLSGWERVEAEALAADLRSHRGAALHQVEAARLEFLKGLNLEFDTPVRLSGGLETKPVDLNLDQAIIWATELRPELRAETYRAQIDAIAVNLALGRRNPTLAIGADYELTGQEFPLRQNNWDMTIGLKIPFSYDFWTELRQKRAEQRQGDIKRAEIHDQVRLEVSQAFSDLQYWQKEWPAREEEYAKLKSLTEAAERGAPAPSLAALRSQVAVLGAEERWLTSVQEHILARSRLERAVGRPFGR